MTRLLTIAALLAVPAAASAGTYSATPSAAASGRIITRTASWTCGAQGCTTATDSSRPVVICQGLAKKVGTLEAFTTDGRALAADELAKCNALARAGSPAEAPALAKN
jgi:hypothetical protein